MESHMVRGKIDPFDNKKEEKDNGYHVYLLS